MMAHQLLHTATKRPPTFRQRPLSESLRLNQPKIASLQALATRIFTTRLAGILIVAPVAGLRPMRAGDIGDAYMPF